MSALFVVFWGLATAGNPLLETWNTRTGLTLHAADGVQVQPAEGGVALVGRGVSLLLAPAKGDAPARSALEGQLAPFLMAGATAPKASSTACTIGGQAASCLEATIEMAPGASMRILAGHRSDADWTVVCLQRSQAASALCDGVLQVVPPKK